MNPRNPYVKLSDLAETFPTLRNREGVRPFNAQQLANTAAGPHFSNAGRQAAAFVLSVYNSSVDWHRPYRDKLYPENNRKALAPFNPGLALAVWDLEHRRAFQAWAADPWVA